LVSVIVPARDEALNIEGCLTSLTSSTYPAFEVIVVDDRSSDDTGRIARSVESGAARRLVVIDGEKLPAGWLGKPWACWQGAQAAEGELLLFTDADTSHGPDLLGRAVAGLAEERADLLTIVGRQLMETFWEKLVQPQVFLAMVCRFPRFESMARSDSWRDAIANGQFLLFRREAYESFGGHRAVKDEVVEDLALAQVVKREGYVLRIRRAHFDLATRMYRSLSHLVEGWSKNIVQGGLQTFPRPLRPLIAPLSLTTGVGLWLAPPLALLLSSIGVLGPAWLIWSAVVWGISVVLWIHFSRRMGAPAVYGLLYPLGALIGTYIFLLSWSRGRRVVWKGRSYELPPVAPDPSRHMDLYRSWIASGHHGEMGYLSRDDSVARRADLLQTMGDVASVILVAHEYFQDDAPGVPDDPSRAVIARYARGEDYHLVVKSKLEQLLAWLDERVEAGVRGRAYVDTGPILERELASRAGLGWFGKNTMLINPTRGSYFFVGLLLVDVEMRADAPFTEDRCGTCRACLDACPTAALLGRGEDGAPVIDARRCISYLTIELRGPIPGELRGPMGNRVFGCDICQEVCPWNERFARPTHEDAYRTREGLDGPALVELAERLLAFDEEGFRQQFRGSPLKRAKRAGLLRNVCVALGNWGSDDALPTLVSALSEPAPLVRAHAAWALGRISTPEARGALATRLPREEDRDVRVEIESALA
jgi:epoxyqueuosine reductase